MLEIKDLHASINGKEILKGINLTVKPGEVHAIMIINTSGIGSYPDSSFPILINLPDLIV